MVNHSDVFSICVAEVLHIDWLVVGPPLWKIWKSIGMISNPIYGKIKFMATSYHLVRCHLLVPNLSTPPSQGFSTMKVTEHNWNWNPKRGLSRNMAGYFPLSPPKKYMVSGENPIYRWGLGVASHDETESPMIWGFGFGVSDSHSLRTCRAFFAKQILKKTPQPKNLAQNYHIAYACEPWCWVICINLHANPIFNDPMCM